MSIEFTKVELQALKCVLAKLELYNTDQTLPTVDKIPEKRKVIVQKMIRRPGGTTTKEVLERLGCKGFGMPEFLRENDMPEISRQDGRCKRYFGSEEDARKWSLLQFPRYSFSLEYRDSQGQWCWKDKTGSGGPFSRKTAAHEDRMNHRAQLRQQTSNVTPIKT